MTNITLLGASGYTGAEFVRLISGHPEFNIVNIVSSSSTDNFTDHYPNFLGENTLNFKQLDIEAMDKNTDCYVTALPHGTSMPIIKELYNKTSKKIVDLGADFRYTDKSIYELWYNLSHSAKEIPSVYGLCELNRENIKKARVIGNPGCYTTCSILGLAPLVKHKKAKLSSIIIDAKSGVTGAGKKCSANTHFCETNENFKAYSIAKHRHTSEIEEQLSFLANENIVLNFTPHLIPVNRGILATIYADLNEEMNKEDIISLYKDFYKDSLFVKIMDKDLPQLKYVVGSNNCYIGLEIDKRTNRVIIVSCIDNLIKGASGQAIQNLNLLFGYEEDLGLNKIAWYL